MTECPMGLEVCYPSCYFWSGENCSYNPKEEATSGFRVILKCPSCGYEFRSMGKPILFEACPQCNRQLVAIA